ncbi:unnamed protein product [Gadus morhua 'NCC']
MQEQHICRRSFQLQGDAAHNHGSDSSSESRQSADLSICHLVPGPPALSGLERSRQNGELSSWVLLTQQQIIPKRSRRLRGHRAESATPSLRLLRHHPPVDKDLTSLSSDTSPGPRQIQSPLSPRLGPDRTKSVAEEEVELFAPRMGWEVFVNYRQRKCGIRPGLRPEVNLARLWESLSRG